MNLLIYLFFIVKHVQEFYRVLIEDFGMEIIIEKNNIIYEEIVYREPNNKIKMSKEFDLKFKEKDNSFISQNFDSQLVTSYIYLIYVNVNILHIFFKKFLT